MRISPSDTTGIWGQLDTHSLGFNKHLMSAQIPIKATFDTSAYAPVHP